jgi:hypothetical protein
MPPVAKMIKQYKKNIPKGAATLRISSPKKDFFTQNAS